MRETQFEFEATVRKIGKGRLGQRFPWDNDSVLRFQIPDICSIERKAKIFGTAFAHTARCNRYLHPGTARHHYRKLPCSDLVCVPFHGHDFEEADAARYFRVRSKVYCQPVLEFLR